MNGLLVRVGADLSTGGGCWNGPVDLSTGEFVYVAIPENSPVHSGLQKPYSSLTPALSAFGVELPAHLRMRHMHLDPDFQHITYGDQGERAKQLKAFLGAGDLIVFYAGLADTRGAAHLAYALIGILVVEDFILATEVTPREPPSPGWRRWATSCCTARTLPQASPQPSAFLIESGNDPLER